MGRRQGEAPPVGRDGLVQAADGAQGVPIVEPETGLARVGRQKLAVDVEHAVMLADEGEAGRQEVAVGGIGRIALKQVLHVGERLGGLLLAELRRGEAEPDAARLGRQTKGMGEQGLGVGEAAEPG